MIAISTLRTPRLQVELTELRATDAIYLCQVPEQRYELGISELLTRIVKPVDKPRKGQVTDHRLWTVQERALVTSHYIAHAINEGADFQIGDNGKLSDYLGEIIAPLDRYALGAIDGTKWSVSPLLGFHAEAIERLVMIDELKADRSGWIVGAMGAMLLPEGMEPLSPEILDADLDVALGDRCKALLELPESTFVLLVTQWLEAMHGVMNHIFSMEFSDDGIVFIPNREGSELVPARFPVADAVRETTQILFGSFERADPGDLAVLLPAV